MPELRSPALQALRKRLAQAAGAGQASILLRGEHGSLPEFYARGLQVAASPWVNATQSLSEGAPDVLPSAAGGDESGGTLAVKRGEIALAMYPVSALMEAGLDAVPLPRDANASIDYVGAVTAAAASPAQAEAFLRFITRAQTLAAWKAKGMDLTN